MRVTMRGYARDHGSFILAEEELADYLAEEGRVGCPEKGCVLEQVSENKMVTLFKFRKRVRANMSGNYVLEVALSNTDVAHLCWLAFRDRALSVLLRLFGAYEQEKIKVEEWIAENHKTREIRQQRRL